ncbi:hypothetical protein ACHAXR_012512 [Thalassiosira sp. AJA248-18]
MADLPVVVVVATHGEDRLHLLTGRALPSIANQTLKADLVVIVSDNEPLGNLLEEEEASSCFDIDYRKNVRLIDNKRTRGNSGTGAWNTGILEALATFGEDCWVAVLDDDDEFLENHIESCLKAASESCQWVVSGIVRCSPSGPRNENLLMSEPKAADFFATNPGVQGSNLFVRVRALLGAGLFDENLPSTTDRDICIRLCDLLSGQEGWFSSTGSYTVIHYADAGRARVSSRGSPAKIQGLKKFYRKYAPRMTDDQRKDFKSRATTLFDCGEEEFLPNFQVESKVETIETMSGDHLPLNIGTVKMLPKLPPTGLCAEKGERTVLFGTITSDQRRIVSLLDDLCKASDAQGCNFNPFIIVFVNANAELARLVKIEIRGRRLRGHILSRTSSAVESILRQCNDVESPAVDEKLPIALARTVLQVFIYNMPHLDNVDAVAIIDDDKRLPKGWSPFSASGGGCNEADILIGRDLRTPPNPSVFSLRTNLIDLLYNMDLIHAEGDGKDDVKSYCLAQGHAESNRYDWYYDLSSSRSDHLEMPVFRDMQMVNNPRKLLQDLLVGSPLCRDVIPLESGPTLQRGGCMVILVKNGRKSLQPLAVQQHAPSINFSDGTISYSRRSDSFWCKQMKIRGFKIAVNELLFVYHDNRFDAAPTPAGIRKNVVQEVIGGTLCRDAKWRKTYIDTRLLEMKSWLARVRGVMISLRNRPYCTVELVRELIAPLEDILNLRKWEEEVFDVIERVCYSLQEYEPNPTDFARLNSFIKFDVAEMKGIEKEWDRARIEEACKKLHEATGEDGIKFIGLGSEGVSFRVNDLLTGRDLLYKVFDLAHSSLPSHETITLLESSYLNCTEDLPPILIRPYYRGTLYRGGGHGMALVKMLRKWKQLNIYHSNLTPDNLLVNEIDETLTVIDIGRDVKYETLQHLYHESFRGMCKRAYLCFRYGQYASNPYALKQLKYWMRDDYSSLRLVGFESFLRLVYDLEVDTSKLLAEKLDDMEAVSGYVVSARDRDDDDADVVERINKAIIKKATELNCPRVGVVIEDPFHHDGHDVAKRRPLWFYRRHLLRMQSRLGFSLEEDDIILVNPRTFEEYVGYHIFVLDYGPGTPQDKGCFLMIKSCPLEYQTILSDVRRTVHCLEASASFKSIVLVADLSKFDGFLRQYSHVIDLDAYIASLKQIEDERLVDHVVMFDGKASEVVKLNKMWLGKDCHSTHSSQGQHYTSTWFGFESIRNLEQYCNNDIVLQMDSDILFHCEERSDGILDCIANFDDMKLVTFAFPTLSSKPQGSRLKHLALDGTPLRFEIRCSFVHLDRIVSILPLQISEDDGSTEGSCLKRGWWRALDYNIQSHNLKSGRGAVGDGKCLFFIHPPNEFKNDDIIKLGLISDMISSNQSPVSNLEKKSPWRKQLNQVNLQCIGIEWLRERPESIVVAIDLSNASYGSAMATLESLRRTRESKMFQGCGVILLDNGSANREDICSAIFKKGRGVFDAKHLSIFAWRKQLTPPDLQMNIRSTCINSNALVFISDGGNFDLHNAVCLLPDIPLKFCCDCGSYYDQTCQCYDDLACEFDGTPCTLLPVCIPSMQGSDGSQLQNTKCFAFSTTEGTLNLEINALVNGNLERIKGAENVCVRIHSECLTGDVFYSMKCDCGIEKLQFMHIMAQEEQMSRPSVLVYIKGHEGRGVGLVNKIRAYEHLDQNPTETHIDALHAIGCESDLRRYDAAVRFIKYKLQVKSIKLFTNNPKKIEAVEKYFGSSYSSQPMPAVRGRYNEKYLKEKVELLGHKGL